MRFWECNIASREANPDPRLFPLIKVPHLGCGINSLIRTHNSTDFFSGGSIQKPGSRLVSRSIYIS